MNRPHDEIRLVARYTAESEDVMEAGGSPQFLQAPKALRAILDYVAYLELQVWGKEEIAKVLASGEERPK